MLSVDAIVGYRLVPLSRTKKIGNIPVVEWLSSGLYQISLGQKVVILENIDPAHLTAALAYDVDRLIRSARETWVSVERQRAAPLPAAWAAIQAYYGAFYYSSALLRLCGRAPSYARTSDLREIRKYLLQTAQTAPFSLVTGQLLIVVNPTATRLDVSRPQTKDGVHEYVWHEIIALLQTVKAGLPLGSLAPAEQAIARGEIDLLIHAAQGLPGSKYLSSGRNDIQYRQKMSSWYPQGKAVKKYNYAGVSLSIWSDATNLSIFDITNEDDFSAFMNRCALISAMAHRVVAKIAAETDGTFLQSAI